MSLPFRNRAEAGRLLAEKLMPYAERPDVLVLGLPRGGVPVAYEIAVKLKLPLDVFLVRKLGAPSQEELALGAVASGGVCFLNESVIQACHIPREKLDQIIARERAELARREQAFRRAAPPSLLNRTVILVDDGLATGASMFAAVRAAREQHPSRIIAAVPVAAPDTLAQVRAEVDEAFCLHTPEDFSAVGEWYQDFSQVTDEEVKGPTGCAKTMKLWRKMLIGLLPVVVVLGIFFGKPDFGPHSAARKAEAKTDVREFTDGLRRFHHDLRRYPTEDDGLHVLLKRPRTIPADAWHGPYVDYIPADPWGRSYIYQCPGARNTDGYDVYSLGPD